MGIWTRRGNLVVAIVLLGGLAATAERPPLRELTVLSEDYPRAYFFRTCEGMARNRRTTYENWDSCFSRLMGIEGKVLREEIPHMPPKNLEFFTRFKREHPKQLVLLHYNGNACDPRTASSEFFAGHWVYYNGAKIVADVPAEEGETEIEVDNPRLFRVNMGRYGDRNEDIGLCMLDADGKPDWHRSEQVQFVSIDVKNKRIRVRRGCYGTKPRAFPARKAYAAAHVTEGPWGRKSNLMWFYNYATCCPRDAKGRVCSEVLADEIAGHFAPGGKLATFDGIQFDVFHYRVRCPGGRGRAPDCDGDGRVDRGFIDGINVYGIGATNFTKQLRAKMGDDRLILADGMSSTHQRAFGILNGIESEGWPHLDDWELRDWSGGLNRHQFWQATAREPKFNYINHKYMARTAEKGVRRPPEVPWSTHRLVFAAAMFTDSAVCYSFAPPAEPGDLYGIWDELQKGREKKLGWLGKPLDRARHLASEQPDVLDGRGFEVFDGEFVNRLKTDTTKLRLEDAVLRFSDKSETIRFTLPDIPAKGPDVFVQVDAYADPMSDYPPEVSRLLWVEAVASGAEPTGDKSRRLMSWIGEEAFVSTFYFPEVAKKDGNGKIDLHFEIEGGEPVWIVGIRVHCHADAMYRLFENGLVLANPSPRSYTFDLKTIAPKRKFRRIAGSPRQDPATNNGKPVGGTVTLGPKDALFLAED